MIRGMPTVLLIFIIHILNLSIIDAVVITHFTSGSLVLLLTNLYSLMAGKLIYLLLLGAWLMEKHNIVSR